MDQELRSLLRRWQSSRSPADEASYLRARLRVGSLSRERLRAAVWLGDEVAREVGAELLGHQAVALKPPKTGVSSFFSGLPVACASYFATTSSSIRASITLSSLG